MTLFGASTSVTGSSVDAPTIVARYLERYPSASVTAVHAHLVASGLELTPTAARVLVREQWRLERQARRKAAREARARKRSHRGAR